MKDEFELEFNELAAKWRKDTMHLSSTRKSAQHPSYQRIIEMGEAAIPYMLKDFLKGDYVHWFWALAAITGENPIPNEQAGNVKAMAEAWVEWGRERGYLQ